MIKFIFFISSLNFLISSFNFSKLVQADSTLPIQKWLLSADQAKGAVEFTAIGRPSALKIQGKGTGPQGTLMIEGARAFGHLTFDLDSLDTGIRTRNDHMKLKYLETGKYRQATLFLPKLIVPDLIRSRRLNPETEAVPFAGMLLLHGVKKPVSGFARLEKDGDQMKVSANFGIKIADYGISTPSFAGITLAEEVQISVEMNAPLTVRQ